jgi:hypothetical protein
MLSLVDLIEARTVDLDLAAYLAAAMRGGASLLVGARPGGAGKTAVMCALLNFVPSETAIVPVGEPAVLTRAARDTRHGETCYLAHEIGAGHYFAYVWGAQARAFFALAGQGHIVASNLHADTLSETYDQLCGENGVSRDDVERVTLKIYLRVDRVGRWDVRRRVSQVYEGGSGEDRLLWRGGENGAFARVGESERVSRRAETTQAELLSALLEQDTRRIADVRRALLSSDAG